MSTVYLHTFSNGGSPFLQSAPPDTGANSMVSVDGSYLVNGGYAYASLAGGADYRTTSEGFAGDLATSVRVKYVSSIGSAYHIAGVRTNFTDINNNYVLYVDWISHTLIMQKNVAGVNTQIGSYDVGSVSAGSTYGLEFVVRGLGTGGQTVEGWWEGALVISPIANTQLTSAGNSNIVCYADTGGPHSLSVGTNFDEFRVRNDLPGSTTSLNTMTTSVSWVMFQ